VFQLFLLLLLLPNVVSTGNMLRNKKTRFVCASFGGDIDLQRLKTADEQTKIFGLASF